MKVLIILEDPTHDAFIIKPVIKRIVDENPMEDLLILAVDRDCNRKGTETKAAARSAEHSGKLIACVACQEVEVWMLALHADKIDVSFREVRAECDPKERFAEPLIDKLGRGGPGDGRKAAMRALKGRVRSLLSRCDELARLRADVDAWWQARST